jgi:hypothetical protein
LIADVGKVFDYGQMYVALSRARSLAGLQIIGFRVSNVKSHPAVGLFTKSLCQRGKGLVKSTLTLAEMHQIRSPGFLRHGE